MTDDYLQGFQDGQRCEKDRKGENLGAVYLLLLCFGTVTGWLWRELATLLHSFMIWAAH